MIRRDEREQPARPSGSTGGKGIAIRMGSAFVRAGRFMPMAMPKINRFKKVRILSEEPQNSRAGEGRREQGSAALWRQRIGCQKSDHLLQFVDNAVDSRQRGKRRRFVAG